MKARLIILLLLSASSFLAQAQQIKSKGSFKLSFEPVAASIDRQGYLYFASDEGVIEKYNQSGELQYHFSPRKKARPSLLEAWQGLRVFVYYQGFQEYLFLNRFLTESERYNLQRFNLSQFNGIATLSADNNLWLIDSNSLTLIKLDLQSGEKLLDNVLSLSLNTSGIDPLFMREYQNLLFISDAKNGLLVFDNLGNYVETLTEDSPSFFSFSRNEIIYTQKQNMILMDIYSKTKREISTADLSYEIVFMENNQVFALSGNRVDILSLN
ncbi:hypothetical protein [Roseivirga sp.]|uniref:hypothetical protein n=1 Tax=Roseivirga sp. TaxID=1964215 RepID=UPI003B52717E